jgi:hypothetical protein
MRTYNFPVHLIETVHSKALCRVRFNSRFKAADMARGFPRNVTTGFFNSVVKAAGAADYAYRVAAGNAVEIFTTSEAPRLSDAQRAILLNLMDFGQDFESDVSTTIEAVEFPVSSASDYSAEKLLAALAAENDAAVARMSALMLEFPTDNEDAARDWPSEDHEWYFYQVRLELAKPMPQSAVAEFKEMLKALHEANMWTGYSTKLNVEQIMQSGRTGLSYEIEVEPDVVSYIVERPACNPALSAVWLWQRVEEASGRPAANSMIFVTAED